MFTATVLSKAPYLGEIPGVAIVNSVQTFRRPDDRVDAFMSALQRVTTPWCFFLDDDDELPSDYLDVLNECASANAPIAYTNEIWRYGDKDTLHRCGTYSQARHLEQPMLIHHLALLRTEDAQQAAKTVPAGRFWPEMLLYWQLAKGGAHWVDRVGYIWSRGDGASHSHRPDAIEAQVRSRIWCEKDMTQ